MKFAICWVRSPLPMILEPGPCLVFTKPRQVSRKLFLFPAPVIKYKCYLLNRYPLSYRKKCKIRLINEHIKNVHIMFFGNLNISGNKINYGTIKIISIMKWALCSPVANVCRSNGSRIIMNIT